MCPYSHLVNNISAPMHPQFVIALIVLLIVFNNVTKCLPRPVCLIAVATASGYHSSCVETRPDETRPEWKCLRFENFNFMLLLNCLRVSVLCWKCLAKWPPKFCHSLIFGTTMHLFFILFNIILILLNTFCLILFNTVEDLLFNTFQTT